MNAPAKVLDKDGNELPGGRSLDEIHNDPQLLCEVAHVWIYDPFGWVLVQKRSINHPGDPGKWDVSAAGHLNAGESAENAAMREAKEELGIEIDLKQLEFIGRKYVEHMSLPANFLHNEYVNFYLLPIGKDTLKLSFDDGEVDDFEWIKFEDFQDETKNPEQNNYVSFDKAYYDFVTSEIKKRCG